MILKNTCYFLLSLITIVKTAVNFDNVFDELNSNTPKDEINDDHGKNALDFSLHQTMLGDSTKNNPLQNNFHRKGVNSLVYSRVLKLFISGSYDTYLGRWDADLKPDPRFGNPPTLATSISLPSTPPFRAQILNMKGTDYGLSYYVLANLNGRRLVSYRYSNGTSEFEQVSMEAFDSITMTTKGIDIIKNTKFAILSGGYNLYKYDFTTGNYAVASQNEFRTNIIEILDKNTFLGYTFTKEIIRKIKVFNTLDLTVIKESKELTTSLSLLKSLKGIFIDGKTETELIEAQDSCALFYVSTVIEVYPNCRLWDEEVDRSFKRVHGFYSIEAFTLIKGSSLVYTGAGDGYIRLWNIASTKENPDIVKSFSHAASIYEIMFLKEYNRVYLSKNYVENGGMDKNPIESFEACLPDNCLLCSQSQVECNKCQEGYAINSDSQCIDCSKEEATDRACNAIRRPWRLLPEEVGSANANAIVEDSYGRPISLKYSSRLFRFMVIDVDPWVADYPPPVESLPEKFNVEIEGVNQAAYNYSYLVHDGGVYLALNFSEDFNNKNLKFSLNYPIFIEKIDITKSLVLIDRTETIVVSGREVIDASTLALIGTGGKIAGTILASTALVTAGLATFNICMPFGAGAFLLSFFQIIEIISRFALINVNFGPILNSLLEGLDEAVGLPEISLDSLYDTTKLKFAIDSRGKLTYFDISPIVFSTIPWFTMAYVVIWTGYLIVKHYMKKKVKLAKRDYQIMRRLKGLRFMVYGMGILEFVLYSTHEIVHHNFTLATQNFISVLSYLFAAASLVFATIETLQIIDFAKKIFYAQDIKEFSDLGSDSLGVDDLVQFYALKSSGLENNSIAKIKNKILDESVRMPLTSKKSRMGQLNRVHPSPKEQLLRRKFRDRGISNHDQSDEEEKDDDVYMGKRRKTRNRNTDEASLDLQLDVDDGSFDMESKKEEETPAEALKRKKFKRRKTKKRKKRLRKKRKPRKSSKESEGIELKRKRKNTSNDHSRSGDSSSNSQNSSFGSLSGDVSYGRRKTGKNKNKISRKTTSKKGSNNVSRGSNKISRESKSKSSSSGQKSSTGSSSSNSRSLIQQAIMRRKLHVYYEFVGDGIKEESMYELTGVTLNIFFILRLIFLEMLMVVFQTMPLVQVMSMNFVNLAYFLWLIKAIHKDGAIVDTCHIVHKMVLEIGIQIFLFMTIFFWLNKDNEFLNTTWSIIIQIICVFTIGMAVFYEFLMLLVNLYASIKKAYLTKKRVKGQLNDVFNQVLQKNNKTYQARPQINMRGVKKMKRRR